MSLNEQDRAPTPVHVYMPDLMCSEGMWRCVKIFLSYRNLRKRLAKIDIAKEKLSKGEILTPEQQENVASESSVRDEMRSLGATDA